MCRLSLLAQETGGDQDEDAVEMMEDDGATTHSGSALEHAESGRAYLHGNRGTQGYFHDENALVWAVREAAFDFEAAAAKLSTRAHVINMSAQQCRETYSQVVARWAVT